MVDLSIANGVLSLHVKGADKFWALRSTLEIPLAHIADVHADTEIATKWWKGFRLMGTNLPGVIAAGTFYRHGDFVFWDVHNPDHTIVITLHDEHYGALVVEVADPSAAIQQIKASLPRKS